MVTILLIAVVILSVALTLSLALTLGYRKGEASLLRALERQRLHASNRESELTDKILSMKGYREFNPITFPAAHDLENTDKEWQEESLLKDDGFRPL